MAVAKGIEADSGMFASGSYQHAILMANLIKTASRTMIGIATRRKNDFERGCAQQRGGLILTEQKKIRVEVEDRRRFEDGPYITWGDPQRDPKPTTAALICWP